MSTRQKRRERVEADILDAATELLAQHGVEGLTVARIAKAIDYTPGALYRYYPSKDAILAELHRVFVTDLEAEMKAALAEVPGALGSADHAIAALVTVANVYTAFSLARPARFRLFAIGLAEPRTLVAPEQAQAALPAYLSLFATLSALFAQAIASGALRRDLAPGATAAAFALALQGPLQVAKLTVHAPAGLIDSEGITASVVDALLVGWGADPALVAAARAY